MRVSLKIACILLLPILISSCSKSNFGVNDNREFVGRWVLTEVFLSPGYGPEVWVSVENGYSYTFESDGRFTSTRFTECSTGSYLVDSNSLILSYDCSGFTTGIENEAGTFIENFTMEDHIMILVPSYLSCVEGCGWKFKKIN